MAYNHPIVGLGGEMAGTGSLGCFAIVHWQPLSYEQYPPMVVARYRPMGIKVDNTRRLEAWSVAILRHHIIPRFALKRMDRIPG